MGDAGFPAPRRFHGILASAMPIAQVLVTAATTRPPPTAAASHLARGDDAGQDAGQHERAGDQADLALELPGLPAAVDGPPVLSQSTMPPASTCCAEAGPGSASWAWPARAPERQTRTTSCVEVATRARRAVLAQRVQRHVVGAGDVPGLELGRGADVDQARGVGAGRRSCRRSVERWGRRRWCWSGHAEISCGVVSGGEGKTGGAGVVEGVVDGDDVAAAGVEQRGHDAGAVAAGAVHPDRAGAGPRRGGRAPRGSGCAPSRRCAARRAPGRGARRGRPVAAGPGASSAARSAKVAVRVARAAARRRPSPRACRWPSRPGGRCRCGPARAAPRRRPRRVSPSRVTGVPHGISQPR